MDIKYSYLGYSLIFLLVWAVFSFEIEGIAYSIYKVFFKMAVAERDTA